MLPLLFLLGMCGAAFAEGEIVILQSPSSIEFQRKEQLPVSLIPEVYSAALGFSISQSSDWKGMKINDPFDYAKAVVSVTIPGLSHIDMAQGHSYPLDTDSPLEEIWSQMEWRVMERFSYTGNKSLVHINLDEGKEASQLQLGELNPEPTQLSVLKHLNPELEYDKAYLNQIALLNGIAKKVGEESVENDGSPDVVWFVVTGMHPLIDRYGLKSKQIVEAKQLLVATLQRLTEAYTKAYNSKVLVAAISSDAPHTRRYRRDAPTENVNELNLAEEYSDDFPVIFNIILWFGIAYAFVLLAVTLGISDMDPGRDSIIYRMTSNRMKKDN
ncbi:ATPase H(+)-transporting accessory protein 2 [Nilaparvata lugens]|uniref:Seminal fluid protein n=1 Tax=Nilaparvata lugens TaxID=108931 RepID=A0A1I9WL89_NILLU|nr:ATPase H(+)-transporting accessory protein 2 [Nilaparvata lugens]APA33909.1 seminal fluid protein [Nilaparvata lugens]